MSDALVTSILAERRESFPCQYRCLERRCGAFGYGVGPCRGSAEQHAEEARHTVLYWGPGGAERITPPRRSWREWLGL